MAKLYEVLLSSEKGPTLLKDGVTPTVAGTWCYRQEQDPRFDHAKTMYLLFHKGRMYCYTSVPDGYGWEKVSGEDGPPFAVD